MKSKSSFRPFAVLLGAACVLCACTAPNSIPKGYTYHNDRFKSANPPPSPKFTQLQRSTMGPEQADAFRLAVNSLVTDLTTRAGLPPKPVYIVKPETMTPFFAMMDNDLRESLRNAGYTLSQTPEGAYPVTYNAMALAGAADGAPNMQIGLYVYDKYTVDARLLTQQEGAFFIPGGDVLNVPFAAYPDFLPAPSRE